MQEEVKRRGRPPLPPEERAERLKQRRKEENERRKAAGYISQKKYRETRKGTYYEFKISINNDKKVLLDQLVAETGLSKPQLFLRALKDKYGIDLE